VDNPKFHTFPGYADEKSDIALQVYCDTIILRLGVFRHNNPGSGDFAQAGRGPDFPRS
jgi:hypothetical protein